jgi:tetratricopeptide (TPR) repeat protein
MRFLLTVTLVFKACLGFSDRFLDTEVRRCMDLMLSHSYDKAFALCDSMQKGHRENSVGYCMEYMLYQYRMLDYFSDVDMEKADRVFDRADSVTSACLKKNPKDINALYYRAAIYGTRAYILIKFKDILKGFTESMKSVALYKEVLKQLPECCDATGALGTYYYWKGVYLDFLPFFEDDRVRGIRMLEKASRCSSYLMIPNIYSLLWVRFNENQYLQALKISEDVLKRYPANRSFIRSKADCLFDLKKWDEARMIYDSLSVLFRESRFSRVQLIEVQAKLAYIYQEKGELNSALETINQVLSCRISKWEKKFIKTHLAWAKNMREKLKAEIKSGRKP